MLWSEASRIAVLERRLDVISGLDLIPGGEEGPVAGLARPGGDEAAEHLLAERLHRDRSPSRVGRHRADRPDNQHAGGAEHGLHLVDALQCAVRIGDDTDTIAAIAGGLLGGYWGASAVPDGWKDLVHGWPGLHAGDLVRLAASAARGGGATAS